MQWALDAVLVLLLVWALLSWAGAPNLTLAEHTIVLAQATEVARLTATLAAYPTPTVRACRAGYGYSYGYTC